MRYEVRPRGVCPSKIVFDINGDIVNNVEFTGGCDGNLKAVSKLIEGMAVEQIVKILKGNTCGRNNTSCADQLATSIFEKYEANKVN